MYWMYMCLPSSHQGGFLLMYHLPPSSFAHSLYMRTSLADRERAVPYIDNP